MAITFTNHALQKMSERGIAKEDVEMALRHPIGAPGPGQPGTVVVQGHAPGGRILKVCVPTVDHDVVVTTYWA